MRVWGPSAWYDMKGISRIVYILVSKKNDLGSDLSTYLTLWWVYLFVSMYFVSGSRDGVDHLAHWNGTSTTNRAFTTSNSTWFDPRFLTPHVCVRGFSKRKKEREFRSWLSLCRFGGVFRPCHHPFLVTSNLYHRCQADVSSLTLEHLRRDAETVRVNPRDCEDDRRWELWQKKGRNHIPVELSSTEWRSLMNIYPQP